MPSTRDLEIVKVKNERANKMSGEETQGLKDITDLAALPVHSTIDVRLNIPSCELCGEEFRNTANRARDKGVHLLGHFRDQVMAGLGQQQASLLCFSFGREVLAEF